MPKFNIDENVTLFEPIEITLEGKTYKIEKVSQDLMDQILSAETGKDPIRQFHILTGADIEELKKVDLRKIGHALRFATQCVLDSFKGVVPNP